MKAYKSPLGKRISQDEKVASDVLAAVGKNKTVQIDGKSYKVKISPNPNK